MANEIFVEDVLFVSLNEKKFPISELETFDSLKIKIAANQPYKTPAGESNAGCAENKEGMIYPLCNVTVPIIPELLIIQDLNEQKDVEKTTISIPTIHDESFQCTINHLVNSDIQRINPLALRKFKVTNFISVATIALNNAGINASLHQTYADEIMKEFNIPDYTTYVKYVIFFVFNGINGLRAQHTIANGFIEAIRNNFKLGSITYIEVGYSVWHQELTAQIKQLLKSAQEDNDLVHGYNQQLLFEPVITTTLQIEKIQVIVKFSITGDTFELFNKLMISENVPFAAIGNFYKILETFKPPESWATKYQQDDLLVLYVLNVKNTSSTLKINPKNYSTIFIVPSKFDEVTQTTLMEMQVETELDAELNINDILIRIFQSLPFKINSCSYEEQFINVDYLMPSPGDLLIPLFHDMVLTDKLISQMLLINESRHLIRERGGIFAYFRWNTHMNPKKYMSCRIHSGITEAKDQSRLNAQGNPILDLGQNHLHIKLFYCPNQIEAERFQAVINNILSYYFRESYQDYLKVDYTKILGVRTNALLSVGKTANKAIPRKYLLHHINPDMFIRDYQRFCRYSPRILLTADDVKNAEDIGTDVMFFPRPEDGNPHAYACDNRPNYPYVGLKVNNLPNSEEYPLLPCCFAAPQADKEKSQRYTYEHGMQKISGVSKIILTSHKSAHRNNFAELPELVNKLLITIDRNAFPLIKNKPSFLRQGTLLNENSVLDALIHAIIDYDKNLRTDDEKENKLYHGISEKQRIYRGLLELRSPSLSKVWDEYDHLSIDELLELFMDIRKDLNKLLVTNISAQSTYGINLVKLSEELLQNNNYLDSRMVWRLLEELFNVNIFLFRRTNEHPNGVLGAPLFLQNYLQIKRHQEAMKYRFTVLLFETMGSTDVKLSYPQIELIYRINWGSNISDIKYTNEPISRRCFFMTNKDRLFLRRIQYCFDQIYSYDGHQNVSIPNYFTLPVLNQCSDSYGKIRLIQFNNICIQSEPLPALDKINIVRNPTGNCKLEPVPLNGAIDFLKLENMDIVSKVVLPDKKGIKQLVGLKAIKRINNAIKPSIEFYIPIEPTKDVMNVGVSNINGPVFLEKESLLNRVSKLAKLARYLTEYIIWIFSIWHHKNGGDMNDQQYIRRFGEERIIIDANNKYPDIIPRLLNKSLDNVIRRGKFIASDIEVRNRLLYALQIRIYQNAEDIINYKNRIHIKNYYYDISDFDMTINSTILYGIDMVKKWINYKFPHYVLYDHIRYSACLNIEEKKKRKKRTSKEEKKGKSRKKKKEEEEEEEKEEKEEEEEEEEEENTDEKEVEHKHAKSECTTQINNQIIPPYFVKLDNLTLLNADNEIEQDTNIYIVQQAKDIGHALFIGKEWYTRGINMGYDSDGNIDYSNTNFRYVSYSSPLELEINYINNVSNNITVLQYKLESTLFTVALLRFI